MKKKQIAGSKKMRSVAQKERNEESRAQAIKQLKELEAERWADTLELDSGKTDDEVRSFLHENGVHLKKVSSVIKNVGDTLETMANRYGSGRPLVTLGKRNKETGQEIYHIPRFVLEKLVECKKELRKEQKRKYWHTRKSGKKQGKKSVKNKSQENAARPSTG